MRASQKYIYVYNIVYEVSSCKQKREQQEQK